MYKQTMHSVATWFTACGTNQNMASNTRPLQIMHNAQLINGYKC